MPERLLKIGDVADWLQLSEPQIRRMAQPGGPLHHARVKIGASARYEYAAVAAFIEAHRGNPTGAQAADEPEG